MPSTNNKSVDWSRTALAMCVHVYTSLGLVFGFVTAAAIAESDYRRAFFALLFAVVVDATDGTLARAIDVNRHTPWVNGRKLDDLVDYLNYTFLPIFLIWHAGWLPGKRHTIGAGLFCAAVPLVLSAFAFVHEGAKEEDRGFFRGFPSYWNIVAFYVALLFTPGSETFVAATLFVLGVLCVVPIRFVYPNRPPCWKLFFLGGACVWGVILFVMLIVFPDVPHWLIGLSLVYPSLYVVLSIWLDCFVIPRSPGS